MAKQYTITTSQAGNTDWQPVSTNNRESNDFSLNLIISSVATASVEFSTFHTNATPISHIELTDRTATSFSTLIAPVVAFRINVSSYTSGSITLEILQGSRS